MARRAWRNVCRVHPATAKNGGSVGSACSGRWYGRRRMPRAGTEQDLDGRVRIAGLAGRRLRGDAGDRFRLLPLQARALRAPRRRRRI